VARSFADEGIEWAVPPSIPEYHCRFCSSSGGAAYTHDGGRFEVRRRYRQRPVWMLLDEAKCHTAAKSEALAVALDIHFVWLPKQCPALNSMDQLWKQLKSEISANQQFPGIYDHADSAERWLLSLTNSEVLRKAGVLSKNFWLKSFLQ
jgi:hypothetical protein